MTDSAWSVWLDRFFDAYYARNPVNATFIGVHRYDDRLPDWSREAREAEARALLASMPADAVGLDAELARGYLEIAAWEATSAQYGWGNPSLYTGEAVFGLLSLLVRPFAALDARLHSAGERLRAVPSFFRDAERILHDAPRAWCERARRECAGARLLLERGLPQLVDDHALLRAAEEAWAAFERFDAFIETELLPRSTEVYACGAEAFDLLLKRAHFFEFSAEELEQLALECLARDSSSVVARSDVFEGGLRGFEDLWRDSVELAERRDLLTYPDWPVHYVEQPAWLRESAPYFYFLPYRAPAVFDQVDVVEYVVPPGPIDTATVKLNHVVHHGSLGHHLQNWHARRAESRIGQIAAVDCASRIAMLCGGSIAEGWACYATDLADEAGFLTESERAVQRAAHRRMAARAVVDVRLHRDSMTLDDAARFYEQRAGMSAQAARAEAVKNSLHPGAACMYLIGWNSIRQLRAELRPPSLRAFHDQLLSFGSVPLSLISRAMRERKPYVLASP